MKKIGIFLIFILLTAGCSKEASWDDINFQLYGAEDKIPSLFFYDYANDKAVLSGNAKVSYEIEITTTSDISGVFHLGRQNAASYYKNDIVKKNFKLKKGQTFTDSGNATFYGETFDKAFILVDISTSAGSNPAKIVKSSVNITK